MKMSSLGQRKSTVGKVPRSDRKIVERGKIDIENLWR
jgi:hypothetical protein